jgi:DNA modification methylase
VPGKEHRLLVGDSTEPLIVSQLMASDVGRDNWLTDLFEQADMVFTDPPYGVEYVGKTKDQLVIQNDRLGDAGTRMLIGDMARAWPLKPGGAYYLCAPAGNLITTFALGLADAEMEIRQSLVWVKHHFVMGRQDYHWRHESILYGWMEGAAHYFVDDRTQDTVIDDTPDPKTLSKAELIDLVHFLRRAQKDSVWYEDRPSASTLHPTIKPTDLVAKGIQNSSRPGELVFDGFVGSGTTIAACEQTRRICRALEIEPKFAAVTLQRCAEMQMHPELVRVYGRA